MGNDKTPLTDPQDFSYSGVFDPDFVYSQLKDFLEVNKNYDISENNVAEKRKEDFLSIDSKYSAEIDYNDYTTFVIQIETVLEGNDKIVVDSNGVEHRFIEGKADLKIYSFLLLNEHNHAHKSPLVEFFNKIYNKYYNKSEIGMLKQKAERDISDTITRFKQLVNMKV